ncbi:uncharacterized protein PRCAT00000773001 [Priceomyces carsonii]|uniref:uncharacterized protein n=1 Tax=Priceomyces carsonii TaxID=28549 RepID=UPI002EDA9B77|nr:unnamed protein product [Priceomyces carsonii]
MISIFRPFKAEPAFNVNYNGIGSTPVLPFHHTIENLTRDVDVKPLHSHNDYWRREPLFDALKVGCQSIESDVWYFPSNYKVERTITETTSKGERSTRQEVNQFKNNEVYVGHNQIYLEPINTLFNLYLNPLYSFLEYSNPEFTVIKDGSNALIDTTDSKHGIFYNSPETPLYFWMDIKTEPSSTYKAIKDLLEPFIKQEFLASYDRGNDEHTSGPIILTLTGNLPTSDIEEEEVRYAYLDAPLYKFTADTSKDELEKISKLSRVASASLEQLIGAEGVKLVQAEDFNAEQREKLSNYFDFAHQYGLKTRIWGGIDWPRYISEKHTKSLYELGCDFLNVDDVKHASLI